jgi:hypothetical protein
MSDPEGDSTSPNRFVALVAFVAFVGQSRAETSGVFDGHFGKCCGSKLIERVNGFEKEAFRGLLYPPPCLSPLLVYFGCETEP